MGVKFDWMSAFQNTSSPIPVQIGQTGFVTRQITIPALTGQYASLNLIPHTWTVEVWDMAVGAVWTNSCNFDDGTSSCHQFNNSNQLAVYSSTQADGIQAEQQASAIITALSDVLSTKQAPPGTNSAIALLSSAQAQLGLGQTAYQTGDFNTAARQHRLSGPRPGEYSGELSGEYSRRLLATVPTIFLGEVAEEGSAGPLHPRGVTAPGLRG